MDNFRACTADRRKRWQARWIAAIGSWSLICVAFLLDAVTWQTAVMAAATALMLVRAADMLDE